jgi:hypothetical protein
MFVSNFPKVIKHLLKDLPQKDYPVLNTFFFTSCWMTKNENGIRIQIYSCLIVYVILQLIEIPQEIGVKIFR